MVFGKVYPLYLAKLEKKGRTKAELDDVIQWLTGYSTDGLGDQIARGTSFETFFSDAPQLNPARHLIKGTICGVRVEDIEDPIVQSVRYLDKLVDEVAKGRPMENILRRV